MGDSLTCMREFPDDARHDAVYVLHAYQKKSTTGIATRKQDIDLIERRLKQAQAIHAQEFRE